MAAISGRYRNDGVAAEGWSVARAVRASRLTGSNGIRAHKDGRIYVAQVAGSQISAIDPDSGDIETISPLGGPVVAPDDIAFDEAGNIFATEITEGRIGMLTPKGEYRVLNGDMPVANPITWHQGRLIAGECRPGGKIGFIDTDDGAFTPILTDVPMPNAFEVGPDGMLYMPIMGTNEIWRVSLDGGTPETVAGDLGLPDSVKFDSKGRILTTQAASGQVLRIDPQTGEREVMAQLAPGLDNVTFIDDRIFVSSIPGEIVEILEPGKTRSIVERGLQWPMGLAVAPDGALFVADGGFTYLLGNDGELNTLGMLFTPGFPGFTRGVAAAGQGEWIVTTANAQVARWRPEAQEMEVLAEGYEILFGVARASDGTVVFADGPAGRLIAVKDGEAEELASGLQHPMGVAVHGDAVLVSEAAAGRVTKVSGGSSETLLDGLKEPQGIAVRGDRLYVVDVLAKELIEYDFGSGARTTIASQLPVKAPPGITPKLLGAVGNLSGPMHSFTSVAAAPDGTIYVSGDAEGSVVALRPE